MEEGFSGLVWIIGLTRKGQSHSLKDNFTKQDCIPKKKILPQEELLMLLGKKVGKLKI